MSDILLALDSGDLAMLTLLDLSATFDTVDHYILWKRVNISYGISHSVFVWLTSYLNNRTQFVQLNGSCSTSSVVTCGVPQGSVLGPILFILYTADLTRLVDAHNLQVYLYAYDTQVYGFCDTEDSASFQNVVSACIDDISAWMRSNRLQLNAAKTEVMLCASSRRMHQVPAVPRSVSVPTTLRPSAPLETSAFIWTLMRP